VPTKAHYQSKKPEKALSGVIAEAVGAENGANVGESKASIKSQKKLP
jgi:hypothetical protein